MRDVREQLVKIIREHTQQSVAEAAGIHRVKVAQFLAGERDVRFAEAVAIAEACGYELVLRPKGGRR